MAEVIKRGEPDYKAKCEYCNSIIGFWDKDIVEKPDGILSSAAMMKFVECPMCRNYIYMGWRHKYMDDNGDFKERYNGHGKYRHTLMIA